MTPAEHTPGPWEYRKGGKANLDIEGDVHYNPHVVAIYRDGEGRRCTAYIAECSSTTADNDANAALIAAAPDLLEAARRHIEEGPLSVEVRSGWHTPGDDNAEDEEYCILLGTGGPAARIVGDLDRGQPSSAHFEYQDWFKPWTQANLTGDEESALLEYAQQFYFEG